MTPTEEYQFNSTNLDSAEYDTDSRDLSITFARDGAVYDFPNVPAEVWQALKAAASPGRYFQQNIKDRY